MTSAVQLIKRVEELMSELGVDKYTFIVSDPDSDEIATGQRGDVCWRAGALHLELDRIRGAWREEYESQ